MKVNEQPFEIRKHDLSGFASVDFHRGEDFNSFALKLVNYNPDRFEPVALRLFIQKEQPIITLFALDKFKQEKDNLPKDKLPVKKFKLKLDWNQFVRTFRRFDFTISNNAFDIQDILVTNK